MLCQTSKEGQPETIDEAFAKIFLDFGNIYESSFEDWWVSTGSNLFAERADPPTVKQINPRAISSENNESSIFVEIPLTLSYETVDIQIRRILEVYSDVRPANRLATSTSDYPIAVALTRMRVLKQLHELHCLHRELITKPKALAALNIGKSSTEYETRADLFRIGKIMRLSPSNERLIGEPEEIQAKLRAMRSLVSRNLAKAHTLIANVERGVFASYDELPPSVDRFTSHQRKKHEKLEEQWWGINLFSSESRISLEDVKQIPYSGDYTNLNA